MQDDIQDPRRYSLNLNSEELRVIILALARFGEPPSNDSELAGRLLAALQPRPDDYRGPQIGGPSMYELRSAQLARQMDRDLPVRLDVAEVGALMDGIAWLRDRFGQGLLLDPSDYNVDTSYWGFDGRQFRFNGPSLLDEFLHRYGRNRPAPVRRTRSKTKVKDQI